MDKTYCVYVLECNDGTLYTGYSNNVEKRVATHNSGKGAKYTRSRTPVTLKYTEIFQSKEEALSAEYRFKRLNRKKKLEIIREKSKELSE
ncbi:MAG: nuclease family protein [Bacillales bacterium]|jgi:putative endonuclease|nr:nuclease family protein [Bacillales bacterium]